MKTIITIALTLIVSVSMAQTKPRKVIIKKHTTVDSIVYLPDTLPVYFKELVIRDTIYERWVKGFVIWQTWEERNYSVALTSSGLVSGSFKTNPLIEWKFPYTETMQDSFLYADKKRVTNKVLNAIER